MNEINSTVEYKNTEVESFETGDKTEGCITSQKGVRDFPDF